MELKDTQEFYPNENVGADKQTLCTYNIYVYVQKYVFITCIIYIIDICMFT